MGGRGDVDKRHGGIGGECVRVCNVDLGSQQLGMSGPQRRGDGLVLVRRDEEHVVRGCDRLGLRWCADGLEERVGLGQIDDARHGDRHRVTAGKIDGHTVAGYDVKVGRGLLGYEDPAAGSREEPDLSGECRRVARRQSEDDGRSGCLRGALRRRRQPAALGEPDRKSFRDAGCGSGGCDNSRRVRALCHLDLPIDRHPRCRASGHRRLGGSEERAEAREHGNRDRDACRCRDQGSRTSADQTAHPQSDHGRVPFLSLCDGGASGRSLPSSIRHRSGSRSATSGSCVLMTRAAPSRSAA